MKLNNIFTLILGLALLPSCIEHEVIPPPTPVVELECSFGGVFNGEEYSFSQFAGIECEPAQEKLITPAPQASRVTYFSTIRGANVLDLIQLNIGELLFQPTANSSNPTLNEFEAFFKSDTEPDFKADSKDGVEIVYRDESGRVWYSSPVDSLNEQFFKFTSLELDSDENGDFMLFTANFSCNLYLYDEETEEPIDTIAVENAVYRNHFKR